MVSSLSIEAAFCSSQYRAVITGKRSEYKEIENLTGEDGKRKTIDIGISRLGRFAFFVSNLFHSSG
jgi:hypothetical protein